MSKKTTNVNLEINDTTEILVDFMLVTQGTKFDFEVSKLIFQDENGEFSLKERSYDLQKQYLRQASDAVDAYLSKNSLEMLIANAEDKYLEFLAINDR